MAIMAKRPMKLFLECLLLQRLSLFYHFNEIFPETFLAFCRGINEMTSFGNVDDVAAIRFASLWQYPHNWKRYRNQYLIRDPNGILKIQGRFVPPAGRRLTAPTIFRFWTRIVSLDPCYDILEQLVKAANKIIHVEVVVERKGKRLVCMLVYRFWTE